MENIKERIALLCGGLGSEHSVSHLTARAVAKVFDSLKLSYRMISSDKDLAHSLSQYKPGLAFLATHGKYAEDGVGQAICEYLKIPYTGSGVLASAICMDKCFFKDYISLHHLPTPDYQTLCLKDYQTNQLDLSVQLPLVVKPAREGSSIGVSICHHEHELSRAITEAFPHDEKILLESYVKGVELALSFLDGQFFTPVEIVPKKEAFYNYKSKYTKGATEYVLPPGVDSSLVEKCKNMARKAVSVLNIRSYCRVDFIVTTEQNPLMIEVNTLPGLTEHSLLPKSAAYDGVDFQEVIQKILKGARLDYQ